MRHFLRACAQLCLPALWCSGGGVFVSSPAYADGYVDGTGNNIYYGFKTDAQYAEAHFNIDVEYYDTFDHAKAGGTEGKDPLGKFVRVHYLSNSNKDATADDWRFRPMWWFGVPAGLKDPQDIQFKRIEKLTKNGKEQVKPAGSSQYVTTDANGYGVVSDKHFNSPKDWNNISNYYFSDKKILASKGWKQLMGLDAKNNKGYDDKGNTAQHWEEYQQQTQGLKGIFVDWESAGQRWYDMTYVSEMTDDAWKKRDENPLRFAAGVYRFAGNWHYAVGQKHNTPKIADHLKLAYPEVTKVKKLDALSDDEQKAIKAKIEKANENTKYFTELVDKDGVVVNKDGSATITFKDNTKRTIPASLLVAKDESDSDKYKPVMPERIPVVNPDSLNDKDKQAVIDAFKKANKDNKDFNDHLAKEKAIEFDAGGKNLVVTYEDGSKATIPVSELVFQGPKISDWAPYVVPDYIEVDDLKKLSDTDVTAIVNAFDKANTDITPYGDAKKGNGDKAPVTVDKATGNATITWEDGSTTEIPSWQFLKQKPKAPTPNPQPPTPTPTAEKTFIVDAPATQTRVKFDPFKMTEADLTNQINAKALDGAKKLYIGEKGKDAKDPTKKVNIKSVEYSVKDGVGYITFKADDYKDATYPMSVFFKKDPGTQTPQTPDTTLHHPGQKTAYQYYVDPVEVDNVNSPSVQNQLAAFKKFMKKNYNVDITDQEAMSAYSLKENDKPVAGVTNMQRYVKGQNNGAGVVSFNLNQDGTIAVQGFETGENDSKKLFDVPLTDLYVKKNSSQPQKDNTIDNLKQQAKDLLKKRKGEGLTKDDLKRAGITDADTLDDNAINGKKEKELLDLIRKLTDAKHIERKYNEPAAIKVKDPNNPTEDDFKKAVEAFVKANYDKSDNFNANTVPTTLPTDLTPKSGTVDMEIADDNIKSVTSSETDGKKDYKSMVFKDAKATKLFTVAISYKKEETTPTPTPDALAQMKKDAEQQIDRNPNLTDDQKKQYKQDIEGAKTVDKIKEILNKAAQQGKDNQNDPSKTQTITDNKGGGNAKKEKEKEQKEKDKKEREKKQEEQTTKDKKSANDTIDGLSDLTQDEKNKLKEKLNGKNGDATKPGAKTPEEVQQIVNEAQARNAAHKAIKDELSFLDHGTGAKDNTEATHADDAALNELLGGTPAKDAALTALEDKIKDDSTATAQEIKDALAAAKRQNAINEENAKNAGIAKLEAKKADLDAAYNALNDEQKAKAKDKYEAAKNAIEAAKKTVEGATKPSDIKNAVDGVKTSLDEANKAIENAKGKRDTTGNTNDSADELTKEKDAQKKRIQDSNLPDAEKKKAIEDIEAAKKLGDPTGIADRALKAKKIEDAKKQIAALDHLNNAQKKAYEDIINSTDAHNIKDDDGKDTGKDDIDNALADAIATDNAMARLEKLKEIADKFANGDKYKGLQDGDDKKKAFDAAATAAGAVLDKAKGDPKNADQVNELYKDLLKAMQAIDDKAKGAGVNTEALNKEIESDKKLKPNTTSDPKTPGDSVYTTASADKKAAFDQALNEAEQALKKANDDNANQAKPESTPRTPEQEAKDQKAVDDALQKLENARKALDGVDTKPLQDEIGKDSNVTNSDKYKYADKSKTDAFDKALKDAQDLISQLGDLEGTGKQYAGKSQKEKQALVDKALQTLKDAAAALDGKKPIEPEPTPTPTPSVDKSHLQQGIDNGSDVHNSDDYNNAPSDKKQAYDHALDHANEVNNDPNATQDQVNQAAEDLKKAENDLKPTPSPLPTPVPGGHEDSGFGVNDNAPTTVDKGELNIQIDSAEADSQPGNAGTGNNNAGNSANANTNAANANNNAANGANSAAVNAAVENSPSVKQADDQVAKAQAALDSALAEAKKVAADPNATQAQVDAAAQKLSAARKALAEAKAHAAQVRASVRAQVLKSGVSQLSKTGSNVSVIGLLATVAAAGAAFFVSKRRGISRHSNN